MFQITLQKMLILARLAIVVSLTAYSLPAASASMHGGWSNTEIGQSGDHHDETTIGGHLLDDQKSSPDNAKKLVKTECCKGFCVSMALVAETNTVGGLRVTSIREFVDDARTKGELPLLHRPPNI
ncbi:hypothetical protein CN186_22375 [Sinorhizobium medicae]|uniref:DUF2946 domain-containing protein n=2 Tax=Sinorhizobium medicae TaxID=110321 RepID=A0A508X4G2_9HYPH|nr:hypothetical protein [Sinorhizobium medicae]RVI90996.1 hypothetical protein CN186_22375 [Sinorhizobium medicae]VTZ64684.1 conserved exported hypothetical protein [Sinorhizobium medicae]